MPFSQFLSQLRPTGSPSPKGPRGEQPIARSRRGRAADGERDLSGLGWIDLPLWLKPAPAECYDDSIQLYGNKSIGA